MHFQLIEGDHGHITPGQVASLTLFARNDNMWRASSGSHEEGAAREDRLG